MILLDTNVISELMLIEPECVVLEWLNRQPRFSVWTTSITVFEMRFGLIAMPEGKRRNARLANFELIFSRLIEGRIVSFDHLAAEQAAKLMFQRKRIGRPGELRDTMIAGIVLATHATLATRNVRHFEEIAASVVNPWEL